MHPSHRLCWLGVKTNKSQELICLSAHFNIHTFELQNLPTLSFRLHLHSERQHENLASSLLLCVQVQDVAFFLSADRSALCLCFNASHIFEVADVIATDHYGVGALSSVAALPHTKETGNEVLGVTSTSLYSGSVLSYRIGCSALSPKNLSIGISRFRLIVVKKQLQTMTMKKFGRHT